MSIRFVLIFNSLAIGKCMCVILIFFQAPSCGVRKRSLQVAFEKVLEGNGASSSAHHSRQMPINLATHFGKSPASSATAATPADSAEEHVGQQPALTTLMEKMQITLDTLVSEKSESVRQKLQESTEGETCDWSKISSLPDLVTIIPTFKLEKRMASHVVCEPCHIFMTSVDGVTYHRQYKRSDSFAFGLKVPSNNEDEFFEGRGCQWTKFKSNLKKHHYALDATADIHCKGLKMLEQLKRQQSAKFVIHKVFIKAAFEVIKTKTAAENFETTLAFYQSLGVNIGNIQHSRKQFPHLLQSLCQGIDRRLDHYLSSPLPSTGAPPHLLLTFDKSTVLKCTNQAVLVIAVLKGKREALFLDAPLVYSVEDGEVELSGGQSESLLFQVKSVVNEHLPNVKLDYIQGAVGAVADGQYQNKKFTSALKKDLNFTDSTYSFLQWDPPHFLDLAAKKQNSEPFMKRLLKRVQHFHSKLGYGKMHQVAENIGHQTGEKTLHTMGTSTTRFLASQFASMKRVSQCYSEYIRALYDFAGMKHNTEEQEDFDEDEALVCGQDFLLDLLGAIDVLSPLVSLMEEVQNLQCPGWKIIPCGQKTINLMRSMLENLRQSGTNW